MATNALRRESPSLEHVRQRGWRRTLATVWASMVAVVALGVCIPSVAQTNQAPILGLTQPREGANFNAPANVTLAALPQDADGIPRVSFCSGSSPLTTDIHVWCLKLVVCIGYQSEEAGRGVN